MKANRILLILAAALSIAAVDGLAVRPLDSKVFRPKSASSPVQVDHKSTQPSQATTLPANEPTAEEIDRLVKAGEVVVLDARVATQYETGHIPFALFMPFEKFAGGKPEALEFYPPEQPFIIYCGGGDCDASEKVKIMLDSYGFTDVRIYHTGWPGWEAYGGEIETGMGAED